MSSPVSVRTSVKCILTSLPRTKKYLVLWMLPCLFKTRWFQWQQTLVLETSGTTIGIHRPQLLAEIVPKFTMIIRHWYHPKVTITHRAWPPCRTARLIQLKWSGGSTPTKHESWEVRGRGAISRSTTGHGKKEVGSEYSLAIGTEVLSLTRVLKQASNWTSRELELAPRIWYMTVARGKSWSFNRAHPRFLIKTQLMGTNQLMRQANYWSMLATHSSTLIQRGSRPAQGLDTMILLQISTNTRIRIQQLHTTVIQAREVIFSTLALLLWLGQVVTIWIKRK